MGGEEDVGGGRGAAPSSPRRLFQEGRTQEALKAIALALPSDPGNLSLLLNQSGAQSELGLFEAALTAATHAAHASPSSAKACVRRAVALNGLGRFGDAEQAAQKARSLGASEAWLDHWCAGNKACALVEAAGTKLGACIPSRPLLLRSNARSVVEDGGGVGFSRGPQGVCVGTPPSPAPLVLVEVDDPVAHVLRALFEAEDPGTPSPRDFVVSHSCPHSLAAACVCLHAIHQTALANNNNNNDDDDEDNNRAVPGDEGLSELLAVWTHARLTTPQAQRLRQRLARLRVALVLGMEGKGFSAGFASQADRVRVAQVVRGWEDELEAELVGGEQPKHAESQQQALALMAAQQVDAVLEPLINSIAEDEAPAIIRKVQSTVTSVLRDNILNDEVPSTSRRVVFRACADIAVERLFAPVLAHLSEGAANRLTEEILEWYEFGGSSDQAHNGDGTGGVRNPLVVRDGHWNRPATAAFYDPFVPIPADDLEVHSLATASKAALAEWLVRFRYCCSEGRSVRITLWCRPPLHLLSTHALYDPTPGVVVVGHGAANDYGLLNVLLLVRAHLRSDAQLITEVDIDSPQDRVSLVESLIGCPDERCLPSLLGLRLVTNVVDLEVPLATNVSLHWAVADTPVSFVDAALGKAQSVVAIALRHVWQQTLHLAWPAGPAPPSTTLLTLAMLAGGVPLQGALPDLGALVPRKDVDARVDALTRVQRECCERLWETGALMLFHAKLERSKLALDDVVFGAHVFRLHSQVRGTCLRAVLWNPDRLDEREAIAQLSPSAPPTHAVEGNVLVVDCFGLEQATGRVWLLLPPEFGRKPLCDFVVMLVDVFSPSPFTTPHALGRFSKTKWKPKSAGVTGPRNRLACERETAGGRVASLVEFEDRFELVVEFKQGKAVARSATVLFEPAAARATSMHFLDGEREVLCVRFAWPVDSEKSRSQTAKKSHNVTWFLPKAVAWD